MRNLLFLLCLTIGISAHSQGNGYTQRVMGTRNGLLSPKIYSLLQDANGYLWIGSEIGVSRYNGYEFHNFQYTANNNQIGKILCMVQDSCAGIWMGGDKGLFYFASDTIFQVAISNTNNIAVESLEVDKAGNLWIGELEKLYLLKAETVLKQSKKPLAQLSIEPFIPNEFRAIDLCTDTEDNLYAAGYTGVFKIDKNNHSLTKLWTNPDPANEVVSVAAISPDTILFTCNGGAITAIIGGKIIELKNKELIGCKVFRNHGALYGLSTKSLELFNGNKLTKLLSFGNLTNYVTAATIDKENNIWIGSWEGLLKFSQTAFTVYALPDNKHQDFFSLLEDKNGRILFGGNAGQLYEYKNGGIEYAADLPKPFERSEVKCIYQNADNSYWFGSGYEGIAQIKNNKPQYWNEQNGLPDNNCESFYPVKNGLLFASTEKGVLTIYPDSAQPIGPNYSFEKKYSRNPKLIGCVAFGNHYFFYGNQGLFRLHNNKLLSDSITGFTIKALYINSISTDKSGNIWIGTQGKGLLECGFKDGAVYLKKQYLKIDGLESDVILSVLTDKNNCIWLSTYTGISCVVNNGGNNQIINFSNNDGLLNSYYQHLKLEQQKNGTVWGLSSMGLFSFNPDSVHNNKVKPTVLLTDILLTKTTNDNKNKIEKIDTTKPISLSYNNNSLQFLFTAISLSDPEKIRYAYRLTGFEDKWTETQNRQADFIFLPPGNYTFELKACNNSNVWTDTAVSYHFTIQPPFWQTWLFRIVASLLMAMLVLSIVKKRISIIKKEAAIKQQMAELEAKALRAQMNPHFIFNSLNAIQECIVTEKVDAAYEYLSKFSRLLRLVLNNSEKEFITLSSEIEMIRLYLSLESLRFRQSFAYEIEVDDELDVDYIQIPSMLIQPFVENALWHGLRHKMGEKKLTIAFVENNNHLTINIEDNGVGREKAAFIKKQKIRSEQFDSKGSVLSQQRLDIMNRQYPMMAKINTVDLVDSEGNAAGTKVTIELPLDLQKQNTN